MTFNGNSADKSIFDRYLRKLFSNYNSENAENGVVDNPLQSMKSFQEQETENNEISIDEKRENYENEFTDDKVLNSILNSSNNLKANEVLRLIVVDHLEKQFFKKVSNKIECYYTTVGIEVNIWTVKVSPHNEEDISQSPVLFIHGLGAGVAHWTKIMDIASSNQVCYFIDLPGFAKSSRPDFSTSLDVVETAFIQFIETWRVNNMIETPLRLVGHSFGGYISFLYSTKYPKNVSSLILLDPWGIYSPNMNIQSLIINKNDVSFMLKMAIAGSKYFNPLTIVRKTGMFGKYLLKNLRNELYIPFKDFIERDIYYDYLIYTNLGLPTGEKAFEQLQTKLLYSKNPLIERNQYFSSMEHIEITLCIGTKSSLYKHYPDQDKQFLDAFGEKQFRYLEFKDINHHIEAHDGFIKFFEDLLSESRKLNHCDI